LLSRTSRRAVALARKVRWPRRGGGVILHEEPAAGGLPCRAPSRAPGGERAPCSHGRLGRGIRRRPLHHPPHLRHRRALGPRGADRARGRRWLAPPPALPARGRSARRGLAALRSEEHTSELQSREKLVCRLLLEKKN